MPLEADKLDESQPEEILLDANEEAKKFSFYMLGSFTVSPDHTKLAYAEDTTGAFLHRPPRTLRLELRALETLPLNL